MNRRLIPRSIRTRLLLAVILSLAVALAAGITAFNVLLGRQLSREADDIARTRARAQLPALHVAKGRLVESEAPDGAGPRGKQPGSEDVIDAEFKRAG